jgi:Dockerin type I domain
MPIRCCFLFLSVVLATSSSQAAFHVMQVEQVIGGVNGNTAAQAIQLRMRSSGQNQVSNASLWAADAAGANRVLLLNIAANVSNSASGAHILFATSAFNSAMINNGAPTFTPDFTLANAIPKSYLNAGRLTFEDDGGNVATAGTVYWSLSWGGSSYTGSNSGNTTNDADGNFGPAFGSALPTLSRQGVIFTGAATAASTSNVANYAFATNPATVTKNSGTSFTVVAAPFISGDYNRDGVVDANDYTTWRQTFGSTVSSPFSNADGNGNSTIDAADYVVWRKQVVSGGAGLGAGDAVSIDTVPEPANLALLTLAILTMRLRRGLLV